MMKVEGEEWMVIRNCPELAEVLVIKPTSGKRLLFIDNLRWLMIAMVVLVHLNVTYGNIGGWYYYEKGSWDIFSKIIFVMFGSFNQAYFMGFLFFIVGYFVPGSLERKGIFRFIGERFVRLGIPTILFMLLLHPLTILIIQAFHHNVPPHLSAGYIKYLTSFEFIGSSGPLWFAFALLIFSGFYTLVKLFFVKNSLSQQNQTDCRITHFKVGTIVILTAGVTFLVRWVQPIGTAFYNMQLCFFPSTLSFLSWAFMPTDIIG